MDDSPPHEIVIVQKGRTEDWEVLRQQCFDIRVQVFHCEQKFPLDTEFDEFVSFVAPAPLNSTPYHFSSSNIHGYLTPSSFIPLSQT